MASEYQNNIELNENILSVPTRRPDQQPCRSEFRDLDGIWPVYDKFYCHCCEREFSETLRFSNRHGLFYCDTCALKLTNIGCWLEYYIPEENMFCFITKYQKGGIKNPVSNDYL